MSGRANNTPKARGFETIPTVSSNKKGTILFNQLGGSKDAQDIINYDWKWMTFIQQLALGRFKWTGLPDTCNERYLEMTLLTEGQAVFFKLGGSVVNSMVMAEQGLDFYGEPQGLKGIDKNGIQYPIPDGKGVMVWDSQLRINKWLNIIMFAEELSEIDRLVRVNRRQQRAMTVWSGPEESLNDLNALMRDMETGEQFRVIHRSMADSGQKVEAIKTGIEYKQQQFHQDRTAVMNQLYNFLGIEHINYEKEAHLLAEEANIAQDSVARVREDALLPRQHAADQLNKLFGLNVKVEWRRDQQDALANDLSETSEDENNG